MTYIVHLLIYLAIFSVVSLSLNLVVGYCGMLTLVQAGYYAIGAYAAALLMVVGGLGFFAAALAAMAIAALTSLAVSLPASRVRGDNFVLLTIVAQALIFSLLNNWSDTVSPLGSLRNLTNGPSGIAPIPRPALFGFRFDQPVAMLWLVAVLTGLAGGAIRRLSMSRWGRTLISMRDDELAARGLGADTLRLKAEAIAISAALTALAGAIYASYIGYIDPTAASLDNSILMLSMVLVGGVGNFRGPILGAFVLIAMPELLRLFAFTESQAANIRLATFGALLIAMMHLRPRGLAGEYRID